MKNAILKYFLCALLLYPSLVFAAISGSTAWEVRTAGSDTNGGGWIAESSGTDFSQQNSPQYAVTDAVTAGTTTITSATANFGTDIVGNTCYVAGGTGSVVAGWYQVLSRTDSATVVMDRSTGLTSGTGTTLRCGGALATLQTVAGLITGGNKVFVKADGTYTTTATVNFSAGNNNPHTQIIGYTTTRTDRGKFTLQAASGSGYYVLTLSTNGGVLMNAILDANNLATSGGLNCTGASSYGYNIKVMKYTNIGINNSCILLRPEVTGGTGTPTVGIKMNAGVLDTAYVHDGAGAGIDCGSAALPVLDSIVARMSGAISDGITGCYAKHNVFDSNGRDGMSFGTGSSNWYNAVYLNNVSINNGRYGLLGNTFATTTPAMPFWDGNAFYGNATAARNSIDNVTGISGISPYTNTSDVTLTGNPFVDAAAGNYSLNSTTGAGLSVRAAGALTTWPGASGSMVSHPDMGAWQHSDVLTCTTQSCAY